MQEGWEINLEKTKSKKMHLKFVILKKKIHGQNLESSLTQSSSLFFDSIRVADWQSFSF